MAVLPCSESTSCLFRTRPVEASDNLVYNEVFWVSISYPALRQKTLRVDVCTVDKSHLEECLVSVNLYFNIFVFMSPFELDNIFNSEYRNFYENLLDSPWLFDLSQTVFFAIAVLIRKTVVVLLNFFLYLLTMQTLIQESICFPKGSFYS